MAHTLSIDDLKDRLLAQLPSVIDRYAPPAAGSYRKGGVYFTLNPGRADRTVGSFYIHETGAKAGKWTDHATGAHGDVLDLIALSLNLPIKDAILEARAFLCLETESPELRRKREAAAIAARARRKADEARQAEAAQTRRNNAKAMWLSAQDTVKGTPVAAYLANRGLDLASLGYQPRALRYHPECHYMHEHTDQDTGEVTMQRLKLPAMVAAICDAAGRHIATHRTYLAINAHGMWAKAPVPDAKKVLGDFRGGAIRLSSGIGPRGGKGAPLNDCAPGTRVYVAEGIETGLSAALIRPDIRVLAAVSLSNMGSLDLPANVAEVVLISDGDVHPEAVAAFDRAIAAHAAKGRTVMVVPAMGPKIDLNDALQGAQKQGGGVMMINAIEGCTRRIGKAQGYLGLPLRDETGDHGPQMVSSWQPTPDEVARLAAGAPVYLTVLGSAHPPVMLHVGKAPMTWLVLITFTLDGNSITTPWAMTGDATSCAITDVAVTAAFEATHPGLTAAYTCQPQKGV